MLIHSKPGQAGQVTLKGKKNHNCRDCGDGKERLSSREILAELSTNSTSAIRCRTDAECYFNKARICGPCINPAKDEKADPSSPDLPF